MKSGPLSAILFMPSSLSGLILQSEYHSILQVSKLKDSADHDWIINRPAITRPSAHDYTKKTCHIVHADF